LGLLTRHRDEPAVAHLLAQCLQKNAPLSMSQRAEKALCRITSQPALDALIDCWMEDKAGDVARHIIEEQGWRHTDKIQWLKFLEKRNRFDEYFVEELAPMVNQPAVARMLAHPEGAKASKTAAEAAAAALGQISETETVDAVIDYWLEDEAGETVRQVVEGRGWKHTTEAQWLKFLSKRNRFDEYFIAELAPLVNNPAVARMLAYPEGSNASKAITKAAATALGQITAPEVVDAVIDCWLEEKASETARQVIEEHGWRHSDETKWLKFLTQRNRFDDYFVAQLAPRINQPAIARMLVHPEAANADQTAIAAAASALCQITALEAVNAVIDYWLDDMAGETARQVVEEQGWHHSDEARWFQFLTKRNRFDEYFVSELSPRINEPVIARVLAHPEGENVDQAAAKAAAAALRQISAPEAVDAVIDCWLEDKAWEIVKQVVEERGWRHSDEARWFRFLTKRNRFDEYFIAEIASLINDPEIAARMLSRLDGRDAYQVASVATAAALGQISGPKAIDTVIDCWLEDKSAAAVRDLINERRWLQFTEIPWSEFCTNREDRVGKTVRKVIEDQDWRHSDEAKWFIYLVATGRFDEYLAEDYEFQILRPEFLAASVGLKARIREAVVKAGEVRMNGLFLVEKRAAELTLADAEALVQINIRNHNWEALAGNLWWLPARQIHDAVQAIIAAKWRPVEAEQAVLLRQLEDLATLLATAALERSGTLPLGPVYQKWLACGETGPFSKKTPSQLKSMLDDETDPPEQIAALGALRKHGQLDTATVAKAGHSGHWMVRWVAVHFGADLTKAMQVNDAGIEWFRRLSILKSADVLWTAKPCEVTRDGLEALREHIARLPDRRAAGGLLLVEAICSHYTSNDIEIEDGAHVMVEEDSFELES